MDNELPWQHPPPDLALPENEVHVWLAALDPGPAEAPDTAQVLSADELLRAEGFVQERDRRRFKMARSILRRILAAYLNVPPTQLVFSTGDFGKPELRPAGRQTSLEFSVTHSGTYVLYAIHPIRRVGIDLEAIHPLPGIDALAERFLTHREQDRFDRFSDAQKQTAFFTCWTRKEAFGKAEGRGFSDDLKKLDLCFLEDTAPEMAISVRREPDVDTLWSVVDLHPVPGYAAALVYEGRGLARRCWTWEESV